MALASAAYVVDPATFTALGVEGFATDARGSGLEPPRHLVWITAERAQVLGIEPVALRLDTTLLEASHLALVAFPT